MSLDAYTTYLKQKNMKIKLLLAVIKKSIFFHILIQYYKEFVRNLLRINNL